MKRGWQVLPFDGRKLKELRMRLGYKQPFISRHTGIAVESLSRYENGRVIPSVTNCRRLAKFFHLSVDYFEPDKESEHD